MSNFVGNNNQTININTIVIIHWYFWLKPENTTVVFVEFMNGYELYLHYELPDDYELINELRSNFNQSKLPKLS